VGRETPSALAHAARDAGVIPCRTRDDLIEAFGLLWRIRLERHADLMARGEPPLDLVDPTTLPSITERALGRALRIIPDAQRDFAAEFGLPGRRGSAGPSVKRSR
jgi:signal-transduction protein with cAMP-binding, CBS, and nucleotidyltransferase domain